MSLPHILKVMGCGSNNETVIDIKGYGFGQ